jgi:hypothetical protein
MGDMEWTGNWVTFLDAMLQVGIFDKRFEPLGVMHLPAHVRRMLIDPRAMPPAAATRDAQSELGLGLGSLKSLG